MIVAKFNISLYIGTTSLDTYRPVPMSPMTALTDVNLFFFSLSILTSDKELTIKKIYKGRVVCLHSPYSIGDDAQCLSTWYITCKYSRVGE